MTSTPRATWMRTEHHGTRGEPPLVVCDGAPIWISAGVGDPGNTDPSRRWCCYRPLDLATTAKCAVLCRGSADPACDVGTLASVAAPAVAGRETRRDAGRMARGRVVRGDRRA